MIEFVTSSTGFQLFSLIGSTIAVLGAVITGLAYHGNQGERYSILNHYISELGETGVSRFSWIFNLSLILTGLCLIPACISLGLMLSGVLPKIGIAAGVVCSIGLSFVGVFPMNKMKPHGIAAMTYFRAGLVMVILFSLGIAFQPASELVLSRWYALAGLLPIVSFSVFLLLIQTASGKDDNPLSLGEMERPKVWPLVIAEWMVFLTLMAWFQLISNGF